MHCASQEPVRNIVTGNMSTGSFPRGAGEERIWGKLGQTFGRRLRKTYSLDAAYLPRLVNYITVTEIFHHCPCYKEKTLVGARGGDENWMYLPAAPPPPAPGVRSMRCCCCRMHSGKNKPPRKIWTRSESSE